MGEGQGEPRNHCLSTLDRLHASGSTSHLAPGLPLQASSLPAGALKAWPFVGPGHPWVQLPQTVGKHTCATGREGDAPKTYLSFKRHHSQVADLLQASGSAAE